MPEEFIRVLIWGKTYPELSAKHVETVCTGGVREDGSPIRLYPVPLRYLKTGEPYSLYDWVEVPVVKSRHDPRPESYKVDPERMRIVGHIGTDGARWTSRRAAIFKDSRWQFGSLNDLIETQRRTKRSMGIIKPGVIEAVILAKKSPGARREYDEKLQQVQGQQHLFLPEYKELAFLPYLIRLSWRCADPACACAAKPHTNAVLDWGLLELARRDGWEKAVAKLREITDLSRKDFRLIMGNFRHRPWQFGIIGLWYPKMQRRIEEQLALF